MSVGGEGFGVDPWAWLHEIDDDATPDLSGFRVIAVTPPAGGDLGRCQRAIDAQSVTPDAVLTELAPDLAGDWIWIVPDDTEPEPDALAALLLRVIKKPDAAVFGCLLIEPRRRGAGTLVSDWAQTISGNGRVRTLTDPGELYQGQLIAVPALGVPAAGMLVRGDAWRFLGGFNTNLPRSYWGLDFGWRANLTGYEVIADPDAQLTNYAGLSDPEEDRAAGLALTVANTPKLWRWLVSARLAVVAVLVAVGYFLGKDPQRSAEEFTGLWRWLGDRRLRAELSDQLASLPTTAASLARTRSLRPSPGSGIRRAAELTAARLGGWLETFTGRGSGVSLDEMTGDDFAGVGAGHARVSLAAVAASALVVAALVASRNTYGAGLLSAAQLLPSPENWAALVASYLNPVAGGTAAGAPWTALVGLASLVTLGHPDWLVTVLVVLAVPLAWLLSFRLLRQLVADRYLAGVGALAYALAPVMIGGVNVGALGTAAVAVLLPVAGYSFRHWLRAERWSWRAAGSAAFWTLLICAVVPLFWVLVLIAALISGLRTAKAKAWLQWGVVLAAPLLTLIGPWGAILLRYPGRLLTGVEPILASQTEAPGWLLALGHPLESGAPVWLSICFFAAAWLAAFGGAVRRPKFSAPAFLVAVGAVVVAVGISRLVVLVPAEEWVRPQALEWLVLLTAALVLAAVGGLDGITAELSTKALGFRHLGSLGIAAFCGLALVASLGWWVIGGQAGLARQPAGAVPAFVHNAQVSATPGRTLVLSAQDGQVRWALSEGDFARLGDSERGLAFGGDAAARGLAASVVSRLVGDSADDQILPDLMRLGVSYVTLSGGEAAQRISINNTPGLGLGTGTAEQFVWPVPGSAIASVTNSTDRAVAGSGLGLPALPGATVEIAQPNDPRWVIEVGSTRLQPVAGGGPGMSLPVGSAQGVLDYHLDGGYPWWAWVQLAGLLVLALLAAPSVRRRAPLAPRRIAGGEQ